MKCVNELIPNESGYQPQHRTQLKEIFVFLVNKALIDDFMWFFHLLMKISTDIEWRLNRLFSLLPKLS